MTGTDDIPNEPIFYAGKRCFNCDEDLFWNLPKRKRQHKQWYNKFYQNSDIANYARSNKCPFFIQHNGMIREISDK